jgi:hypothetical protein
MVKLLAPAGAGGGATCSNNEAQQHQVGSWLMVVKACGSSIFSSGRGQEREAGVLQQQGPSTLLVLLDNRRMGAAAQLVTHASSAA